jgi:poly-beta-1,6-N-acetyl-D-glucosamine synthase
MITIVSITVFITLFYLAYPLWLSVLAPVNSGDGDQPGRMTGVSVILLSYNGIKYLDGKISFLLRELAGFERWELIIIDDHSHDGSAGLLRGLAPDERIKILFNDRHEGIPFSMNLGIATASFDRVIFCDQRQELSENIVSRIVEPLMDGNTGAVSGCITPVDRAGKSSFIRRHENLMKCRESRAGSLIGVYGPFYAIRKECYHVIPRNIILDDLYLSLRILKTKRIVLVKECRITDDCFTLLYDYQRAKRYLTGLLQLLRQPSLIRDLGYRQRVMLVWHKYLRLFIPPLMFACYVMLGREVMNGIGYAMAFGVLTMAVLMSLLPARYRFLFRIRCIIRLNILYFLAFLDIILHDVVLDRFTFRAKPGLETGKI